MRLRPGLRHGPRWGSLDRSARPLAGFKEAGGRGREKGGKGKGREERGRERGEGVGG